MRSFIRLGLGLTLLPLFTLTPGCMKKGDSSSPGGGDALGTSFAAPTEVSRDHAKSRGSQAKRGDRGGRGGGSSAAFEPAPSASEGADFRGDFEADEIAADIERLLEGRSEVELALKGVGEGRSGSGRSSPSRIQQPKERTDG